MSTDRFNHHQPTDESGKRLCKVCNGPLPSNRYSYCSKDCWERNTPQIMRYRVRARDKGVCALCGINTEQIHAQLEYLRYPSGLWQLDEDERGPLERMFSAAAEALKEYVRKNGIPTKWEADHIKPVVEGGGLCGLDGYRTLCTECHKKESAKLAARRAEERRFKGQPLLHGL